MDDRGAYGYSCFHGWLEGLVSDQSRLTLLGLRSVGMDRDREAERVRALVGAVEVVASRETEREGRESSVSASETSLCRPA